MFFQLDFLRRLLAILVIIGSFALSFVFLDYHQFRHANLIKSNETVNFEIRSGDSINSIANQFAEKNWIRHPVYLKVFARLNHLSDIKVGHYAITPDMNVQSVLQMFVDNAVTLQKVTFIEGWTFKQMRQQISALEDIRHTLKDVSDEQIMQMLNMADQHPEGWFLPETYSYASGTRDLDLMQHALQAMQSTLEELWQKRQENLPLASPYEALILASIVEKETGAAEERPLIAGVFMTRLRKKMKLQTDPTVIYGMGERYKGNIKREHLREATAYNTYVIPGLPPTPISLPGRAAIEAVTQPDEQGYIYFVARGDGSGTHYFSRTLDEHNKAVRKYQLKK